MFKTTTNMSDIAKEFWLSESSAKVFQIANAEQKTVQPLIAKIIEKYNPKKLLDYGCGDSFVSRLISNDIEVGLYDININEAQKALSSLKEKTTKLFESPNEIPHDYYECIVFSLVLICLSSKQEFRDILSNFRKFKTEEGRFILVTTHPCFRQYDYRPFYTEYTKGKPFNYFNELEPFEVYIRDNENEAVHFTDFHWSLSDTINEISSSGFILERMIEVPDMTFDELPANKQFSPFIILICK